MKASLKFREDQKPLVRAKIPLSILGFPFLSGISAGDSKELCLNLSTGFEAGPSLKISYRPNDSWNPFSLVVKTGIGFFGSPISAPLSMSAEFNLLGRGNPTFFLQFKPQIGDFSVKKIAGSSIALPSEPLVFRPKIKEVEKDPDTDGEGSIDGGEAPIGNGNSRPESVIFSGKKANGFPPDLRSDLQSGGVIDGLLSGVEVSARSVLPLRNNALLKFRWGVRFPGVLPEDGNHRHPTAEISSIRKIPLLVMNKISIEHVAEDGKTSEKGRTAGSSFLTGNADVADACYSVRRQLEALQGENGLLRKAVEELRLDIGAGKYTPAVLCQNSGKHEKSSVDSDKNGGKSGAGKKDRRSESKAPEFGGYAGKVMEDDVNEDLKKALMGATGAGI